MTDATVLTLKHWGNSLGVRLPAAIARAARLQADQQVQVRVDEGRVVIEPLADEPLTLAQRLARFEHDIVGDVDDIVDRAYAGIEQLAVERLCGVMQQAVFDAALQQNANADAPFRGVVQSAAEAASRQEISIGNQDALACLRNGSEIGVLDVTTVTNVVAHDKGGALIAAYRS